MSIEKYIDSKKYAWSPTTLRSERYRLQSVVAHVDGIPETLWLHIQTLKPYSRLTTWTRVTEYYQFLLATGERNGQNPYKEWRKANARVFKNTYTKAKPNLSFEEAKRRIESLSDLAVRRRALEILGSGARYSESGRCDEGQVIGKGSKVRVLHKPAVAGPDYSGSYGHFREVLQGLGLKPHDLRKLFLTRLVELGANPFELAEIAGWSSIETASSYIKVNSDRIRNLVGQV